MWATIDKFLLDEIGGIKSPDYYEPTYTPGGLAHVRIAPYVPDDVHFVRASVRTVRGVVKAEWWRNAQTLRYNVDIPGNTQAALSLPTLGLGDVTITEGAQTIWKGEQFHPGPDAVTNGRRSGTAITFDLGPGQYQFTLTEPQAPSRRRLGS